MFLPHLIVDANGHSVLTETDLKMAAPGGLPIGDASLQRLQAASQGVNYWQIGQALPGHFMDFAPVPTPTFLAVFSGQMNVVASNGEERQLARGDMMMFEDAHGQGHMTRFLGQEPCTYLAIAMPGGLK
jgi:uncharacterized cupin superfamily protein